MRPRKIHLVLEGEAKTVCGRKVTGRHVHVTEELVLANCPECAAEARRAWRER